MLRKIPQHVRVPERLLVAEGKFGNAVAAGVCKSRVRAIGDFPPPVGKTATKIHILEPHRLEILVETADALPSFAADREARSGGLLYELRFRVVKIKAAVAPVPRVARPRPVQKQHFGEHRSESREPAKLKSPLRLPAGIE